MKVGILGFGRAGRRHSANAEALGHPHLVYDIDQPHPHSRQEVIDWADVIVIATPAHCHLDDIHDCPDKPVLCEKPLALTRQYEAAKQVIERRTAPLFVGFNLRFHPAIYELKRCIAKFPKEPPYYVWLACCQYTEQPAPLTNGVANDWLCHEVDLASWLLGPLRVLDHQTGRFDLHAGRFDHEADRFQANLRLVHWPTGAQVHIHSDMRAKVPVRRGLVIADEWSLQYDLERYPVTNDDYKAELDAFLNCKYGLLGEPYPSAQLCTAEEALQTLFICKRADTNLALHYNKTAS